MAKSNKSTKNQPITKTKDSLEFLFLAGVIITAFLIYSFSLFRPWLPFDEESIYKETFFSFPTKFEEIFEVINSFILNAHIISMNYFFSNHVVLRSNPIASSIIVFVSYFFKEQAILWHILQLSVHLTNSVLVFFIFKKSFEIINNKKPITSIGYLAISIPTVIWAIHSANTEAILLTTNWTTLLTYTFCFSFILYELSNKKRRKILISALFLLLMFLTEYGYSLPLIILLITFAYKTRDSRSVRESAITAFKVSLPYFIGLFLFILISFFRPDSAINNIFSSQKTSLNYAFFERNLWFVPQLFIHFLKLLFFPKTLSLYQSNLVHLSDKLLSPYSIFCCLAYFLFLILPLVLFLFCRKEKHGFIYPLIYAFYFSIFPFLHIITPTYCLSADRYCYFPSFILLFILIQPIYLLLDNQSHKLLKPVFVFLLFIAFLLGCRTLIRIQEWNDPYKLYYSAVKSENNPLYKGQRLIILADYVSENSNNSLKERLLQDSLKLSNKALKQFKNKSEKNQEEPLTLKLYGLDYNSLILKTAYLIAITKSYYYQESPKEILKFLRPYFEENLDSIGINQIVFYSEILLKAGLLDEVKNVLEYGYKKYNFSDKIANKLAEYYMFYENDFDKSYRMLHHVYSLFPNNILILEKLSKYYEQKKDFTKEANFAYLLGLRKHSPEAYQLAAKIYLDSNQLELAGKTLKKLVILKNDDPLTLLLTSRYLDLTGQRNKILEVLNSALIVSNRLGDKQDINVTKNILLSLINVHLHLRDISSARQLLNTYEGIKTLTPEDRLQIQTVKKTIEDIEKKQNN